jgi:hypothetical protein
MDECHKHSGLGEGESSNTKNFFSNNTHTAQKSPGCMWMAKEEEERVEGIKLPPPPLLLKQQ